MVEEPETPKAEEELPGDLGSEEIPEEAPEPEIPGEEVPGEEIPGEEGKPIFEVEGKGITKAEAEKGYLRQADYTKKTQALAADQKRLAPYHAAEAVLLKHPQLAAKVKALIEKEMGTEVNPTETRLTKIEERGADRDLDQEIQEVKAECEKRGDAFDMKAILQVGVDENLPNFRAAYKSWAFTKQRAKGGEDEAAAQARRRSGKIPRSGGPKDRTPKKKVIRNYQDAVEESKKELK